MKWANFLNFPRPVKIAAGLFVIIAIYVARQESPIDPIAVPVQGPLPTLIANKDLARVERLFKGQVRGPEAFTFDSNAILYTGLSDGRIIRVATRVDEEPFQPETVTFIGDPNRALPFPCGEYQTEHICGRPLGLKFDKTGKLIVSDAYFGILSIDVDKREKKVLTTKPSKPVSSGAMKGKNKNLNPLDQRAFRFTNDLDISNNGTIYFTDSSHIDRRNVFYAILEGANTGRLSAYHPREKFTEVLATGLHFPNGVRVSKDQTALYFAETMQYRVQKLYISGEKKGTFETFANNLPCMPDNIDWDEEEKYMYVGCANKRSTPFSMTDFLADKPEWRRFIAKITPAKWLPYFAQKYGLYLKLSSKGEVVESPQDPSGKISPVSSVVPKEGYLYIGSYSPDFNFIARAPIHKD